MMMLTEPTIIINIIEQIHNSGPLQIIITVIVMPKLCMPRMTAVSFIIMLCIAIIKMNISIANIIIIKVTARDKTCAASIFFQPDSVLLVMLFNSVMVTIISFIVIG